MTDLSPGEYSTVTNDGFSVSSNAETADAITENFDSQAKPKDGEPADPKKDEQEKVSKAASELGKRGGKAAAEARKETIKAESDEPDEDDEPDEEAELKAAEEAEKAGKLGKPRHDPRARMLQKAREAADLKRQLAQKDTELQSLRASQRPAPVVEPPKPAQRPAVASDDDPEPAEPDPSKFANWDDLYKAQSKYTKDIALWGARQVARENETRARESFTKNHREREIHSAIHGFVERIAGVKPNDPQYASKYEAFMGKVHPAIADLQPSFRLPEGQMAGPLNVMADEIVISEQAPGLLTYLSENPDEIQRIATLRTPREIQREMAKLETRVEAATADASPKREVSKANPPVRSVTGSPHGVNLDADDGESFETHVRRENTREKRVMRAGARP